MGLFDDILDTTVKVAGVTLSVAGGVAVNTVRGQLPRWETRRKSCPVSPGSI